MSKSPGPMAFVVAVLVGLSLVGCSGQTPSDDVPSTESTTTASGFDRAVPWTPHAAITLPEMSEAQKLEARELFLSNVWKQSKEEWPELQDPPSVELVQFGNPTTADQALADCFTESGYPAIASPQGGVEYPDGVPASPQFAIVDYTCAAKYTPDPLMLQDWNADQLGMLYDYRVEWLIPCLETFGLSPAEFGDKTTFINGFLNGDRTARTWVPEEAARASANQQEILRTCPNLPVEYFYGS